jgi:hypothetical protein
MLRHDDELPEDHATLIQLASDVPVHMTPLDAVPAMLPEQRAVAISDEASSLVDGPLVGFATHGR